MSSPMVPRSVSTVSSFWSGPAFLMDVKRPSSPHRSAAEMSTCWAGACGIAEVATMLPVPLLPEELGGRRPSGGAAMDCEKGDDMPGGGPFPSEAPFCWGYEDEALLAPFPVAAAYQVSRCSPLAATMFRCASVKLRRPGDMDVCAVVEIRTHSASVGDSSVLSGAVRPVHACRSQRRKVLRLRALVL